MNLITDPWIPVIGTDGQNKLLGLAELFKQLKEIRDLDVKPHERIALMRFLICIVQATIQPADPQEWEQCKDQIPSRVVTYLEQWKPNPFFELLGEGGQFNFLQVPNLARNADEGINNVSITKLDMMLASGNNATLFDNAAAVKRTLESSHIALSLLTYQNFSPGGLIGVVNWNNAATPGNGTSEHAPCTSKVHCFIKGDNLLDTLHWNILTGERIGDNYGWDDDENPKWGKPLWEEPVQSLENQSAKENATMTYLGRLVPVSRCVRLCFNDDRECDGIILANGLTYPSYPEFREPTVTIIRVKDDNIELSASLEKGLWRQLSSISIKYYKRVGNGLSGPIVLNNLPENQPCKLWSGALVTDKAKIRDTLESIYDVPAKMFKDEGRQVYEEGIHYAETWAAKLSDAIKEFIHQLNRDKKQTPRPKALSFFWGNLEQHVSLLLQLVDEKQTSAWGETPWGKKVKATAFKAYENVCPQQTVREIQAYALGLKKFYENEEE